MQVAVHDDVGRGTFLAIYLGSGVTATYASLVINVLRKRWATYSFGASAATYGVLAATCVLWANEKLKFMGYDIPVGGTVLLGILTGFEIMASRVPFLAARVAFDGHFGGLIFGSVAALLYQHEARKTLMVRREATADEGGT